MKRGQPDLFGQQDGPKRYEVHEHAYVRGRTGSFSHSHDGGDRPHQHADTGPGCYTIDKDEWFQATGLSGGGRKSFTPAPIGEQLPIVELEPWQTTFEVIVCDPPAKYSGEGGGVLTALRMVKAFGMTARVVDGTDDSRHRSSTGVKK